MNNLFVETTTQNTVKVGRKLQATIKVEQIVAPIASEFLATVTSEEFLKDEANAAAVADSQQTHKAMEALLEQYGATTKVLDQSEWLKDEDPTVLNKMLKSQQSKRSRARGAERTLENYRKLVEATLCEYATRKALGKERKASAMSDYTQLVLDDETKERLTADQEALRREIRNTQSKKSIMKRREDFSEEDPNWLALVAYETSLKEIRVAVPRGVNVAVSKQLEAVNEALSAVDDIEQLKAKEAKELLKKVSEALATKF